MNKSIDKIVDDLYSNAWRADSWDKLKGLNAAQLNETAEKLCRLHDDKNNCTESDFDIIIKCVLTARANCYNDEFKWNKENRKQFLFINEQLLAVCEKSWQQALDKAIELEQQMHRGDCFYSDYEIDVEITCYRATDRQNAEELAVYMSEQTSTLTMQISRHMIDRLTKYPLPLMVDRSTNWNIWRFSEIFQNDYICYALYTLAESQKWSFYDILAMDNMWADVKVRYQHCEKLKSAK